MTIDYPVFTCVKCEKPEHTRLLGKTYDMWNWFKLSGLLGYALENGIQNLNSKKKIEFIKEKTGICLIKNENGQQRWEI